MFCLRKFYLPLNAIFCISVQLRAPTLILSIVLSHLPAFGSQQTCSDFLLCNVPVLERHEALCPFSSCPYDYLRKFQEIDAADLRRPDYRIYGRQINHLLARNGSSKTPCLKSDRMKNYLLDAGTTFHTQHGSSRRSNSSTARILLLSTRTFSGIFRFEPNQRLALRTNRRLCIPSWEPLVTASHAPQCWNVHSCTLPMSKDMSTCL